MQLDFHYYATYCAAYLAGYSHEESLSICQSAQFVDRCTATLLTKLKAPRAAATTQLPLEMMENSSDRVGRENITRIWSSFHFLPYDLYAAKKRCGKRYLDKYRLICQPNSDLAVETVKLAKGSSLQAVGVAMHVLADTWAHRNFAGTPSLVINNTNYHFYELLTDGENVTKRKIKFIHSAVAKDDFENGVYVNSLYQASENAVMNIGHGRAGHLPDYSFARYQYLPAWADYEEITKDNPKEYYLAFCQMVYALRYLRGETQAFEKETYDFETVAPWESQIKTVLQKRQGKEEACADWKALGEKMSGTAIGDFDMEDYQAEYLNAADSGKDDTYIGKFIQAAIAHKSMVTNMIFKSGNKLAGFPKDYERPAALLRRARKKEAAERKGGGEA